MIEELKGILSSEGVTSAAIIDDVFDETPTSEDIDDTSWNIFLDDQSDLEIDVIREQYAISDPESRWEELRKDDNFVRFLWDKRETSEIFRSLFGSFVQRQKSGKDLLEPLRALLFDQLKLQGGTYGVRQGVAGETAQLLFVDLFLGSQQDDEAKKKALDLVKGIVDPRRENPPLIVLMSSSQRLAKLRDEFRDDAGLFGCQFRTAQKIDLSEPVEVQELIYGLSCSYRDSLKLSGSVEAWQQALSDAKTRFLTNVRRLDLRDYADLQDLILSAEGELIGEYLLEVLGQYFQYELEQDAR